MELIKKGRVGLITGGARGIGYAAARNLAREGAVLVLVDINGDRVKESARKLSEETGTEAIGIAADISSESDVKKMVLEATDRFGRIDLFLNSAAILSDNLFLEFDAGPVGPDAQSLSLRPDAVSAQHPSRHGRAQIRARRMHGIGFCTLRSITPVVLRGREGWRDCAWSSRWRRRSAAPVSP